MNCPVCGDSMGDRGYVLGIVNALGQRVCTPNVLRIRTPENYVEAMATHGLRDLPSKQAIEDIALQRWLALFRWIPRGAWEGRGCG